MYVAFTFWRFASAGQVMNRKEFTCSKPLDFYCPSTLLSRSSASLTLFLACFLCPLHVQCHQVVIIQVPRLVSQTIAQQLIHVIN